MKKSLRSGHIGVLTSGGDTPGLNAAIRGIGKTASGSHSMQIIGFRDGFRGLMENRSVRLDDQMLSGILTLGGTILGTSRDKPHKMPMGGKKVDMTDVIIENYHKHHLDVLMCLGGGGTLKNAYHLSQCGLNVIHLPKTIDNDIVGTDVTFGFDTALGIAVDAIDRLHSTASSHHRVIIVEIMGHRVGWLALGAGLAGGADAILLPEIPYTIDKLADSILERVSRGKRFSIVAVAEGAITVEGHRQLSEIQKKLEGAKGKERSELKAKLKAVEARYRGSTMQMAEELQMITGLETRVTILGHLQRGGTPSAADRILATRLGTEAVDYIRNEQFGVMVAVKGEKTQGVPMNECAGRVNYVPADHPWILSARNLGTSFGD
ncbi:MAG: 6-phosphofructokinase [Bacteroidetes bacterium]|nr:MAG: 6-phosphofructokinase [Bacteroidota bacterium]